MVVLGWQREPEGRVGQAPLEQISCPTYLEDGSGQTMQHCRDRIQHLLMTELEKDFMLTAHIAGEKRAIKVQADDRNDAMDGRSSDT